MVEQIQILRLWRNLAYSRRPKPHPLKTPILLGVRVNSLGTDRPESTNGARGGVGNFETLRTRFLIHLNFNLENARWELK